MAWEIKDDHFDLRQSRRVATFHNSDTGATHQLIHLFGVKSCPCCGALQIDDSEPIDFQEQKMDTLVALNQHHRKTLAYREQHPAVPVRNSK